MADQSQNVPKEFVHARDHQLLPPRVGHNWNDQAFRKVQDKPQQLEGELLGKRAFLSTNPSPPPQPPMDTLSDNAQRLLAALTTSSRDARGGTAGRLAFSTSGGGRGGGTLGGNASSSSSQSRALTLDDKVLRFYAYFRERAPEGGANDFWHRRVVIQLHLADSSILIEEPAIPNSGMFGGIFLRRQRVKANPWQRELFPADEFLTVNFFNVGETVAINAVDFHLYDCDGFTREFLGSLGVPVGAATDCPDDAFMEAYKRHQQTVLGAKFGVQSVDFNAGEVERTARYMRDGGKLLRFQALLDERPTGGIVRRLELTLFVEDNSIVVTEAATLPEVTPAMFLSRCFLPKSGSLERVCALSFSHRVNGQREPDMGPLGIYEDVDLGVGVTVNVLGRPVLLYACDDFTREFYAQRFGVALAADMTAEIEAEFFPPPPNSSRKGGAASNSGNTNTNTNSNSGRNLSPAPAADEELRFRLVLTRYVHSDDHLRRFTLTYYTATNDVSVYETTARQPGGGSGGGGGGGAVCLLKKQQLRKPIAPHGPRNDPAEKLRATLAATRTADAATHAATGGGGGIRGSRGRGPASGESGCFGEEPEVYEASDFFIGAEFPVCGMPMRISMADLRTEAYLSSGGRPVSTAPSESTVDRLLCELLEFLGSRYGSAANVFLAFDHDRDGIIGLSEFIRSLAAFQITDDPALAEQLFARIAGSPFAAYYLTTADVMRWMGKAGSNTGTGTGGGGGGSGGSTISPTTAPPPLPILSSSAAHGLLGSDKAAQSQTIATRNMANAVLSELRARLEARRMNSQGMFRLASTMPRAYKKTAQGRATLHTLSNPDRDTSITPVQLRRCCEEILGTAFTEEEMACAVGFFFPDMPEGERFRRRDETLEFAVDLPMFQARYHEMCRLAMLPDSGTAVATAAAAGGPPGMKTSII